MQPALAVSLAIVVMLLTGSLHPPAGATALIAVVGSKEVIDSGFAYLIFPIFLGSCVQVGIACVVNNLGGTGSEDRHFPVYWKFWSKYQGPSLATCKH